MLPESILKVYKYLLLNKKSGRASGERFLPANHILYLLYRMNSRENKGPIGVFYINVEKSVRFYYNRMVRNGGNYESQEIHGKVFYGSNAYNT